MLRGIFAIAAIKVVFFEFLRATLHIKRCVLENGITFPVIFILIFSLCCVLQ